MLQAIPPPVDPLQVVLITLGLILLVLLILPIVYGVLLLTDQRNGLLRLVTYHKEHPVRFVMVVLLFIIYLPIVYQVHLDILAASVSVDLGGPGLWWISSGYMLFPIPFNFQWIGSATLLMLTPLTPLDTWAYYNFVPNSTLRLIWSFLWAIIGLFYVVWPLIRKRGRYPR